MFSKIINVKNFNKVSNGIYRAVEKVIEVCEKNGERFLKDVENEEWHLKHTNDDKLKEIIKNKNTKPARRVAAKKILYKK